MINLDFHHCERRLSNSLGTGSLLWNAWKCTKKWMLFKCSPKCITMSIFHTWHITVLCWTSWILFYFCSWNFSFIALFYFWHLEIFNVVWRLNFHNWKQPDTMWQMLTIAWSCILHVISSNQNGQCKNFQKWIV